MKLTNYIGRMALTAGSAVQLFRMAAGSKKGKLVSQLEERQLDRIRQDVGKWRMALMMAENVECPDREELYRLYEDLMIDNHLSSMIEKRKLAVLASPFRMATAAGEEDKVKTKLLQKPWFYDFCNHALDSIPLGHSLIEFGDLVGGELSGVELIPRQHVVPEAGFVRRYMGDWEGIPYREGPLNKYLVEVGGRKDLGLLKKAAPAVLWKKNGSTAWAEYTQIFGMPLRKAKSSNYDKGSRAKLENMLKKMGQASYVILEDGEEVEFVETNRPDAYMVFDKLIERNNSELSKLILGQTMTTDNGSSRSQSEVHERVAENYTKADKIMLANVINLQLLPKLRALGYPFSKTDVFEWDESESLGLEALWKVVEGIIKTGRYKIKSEYITKTFGVPVEETEPTRGDVGAPEPAPQPAPGGGPGVGKLQTQPPQPTMKAKTIEYRIPVFLAHSSCCTFEMREKEEFSSVSSAFKALLEKVFGGNISFDKAYFAALADTLLEAFEKGWSSTGLPTNVAADMEKLMRKNIFRFSAGKTLALVKELNDLSKKAESFDQFRQNVDSLDASYNRNYLRTEYNYTRAAAQNGARWLRQKAEVETYPFLKWQTVGDANVRASHQALDGKVFDIRIEAPVPYPPADWNCRCELVQVTDDEFGQADLVTNAGVKGLFSDEEWEKMEQAGMLVNRGETGQIFAANQMYVSRLTKEAREAINEQIN